MTTVELVPGAKITLRGADGTNLATLTVVRVTQKRNVLCECELVEDADRVELVLLKELAGAADDLAFAVMARAEEELATLGVFLEQNGGRLELGTDFFGLVLTEGGQRAAFQVASSAAPEQ